MKIAVIPARGGSKRIPRKNIKDFCGKPIMAYSIIAAQESGLFDEIIVSTDDQEIATIAQKLGASVPFLRPKELADDYASSLTVIGHALNALSGLGRTADVACCIYATAPFIRADDLIESNRLLIEGNWNYVFGATHYDFPVQRAIVRSSNGAISMQYPEYAFTRSQDLPEVLHDAGQFCWGRASSFINEVSPFAGNSSAYVLPRYLVQDIDTPEDWLNAELMFKALSYKDI